MPLGGSKGTKGRLLLPQAWANTGGEQMYRQAKRSADSRRDQRGEKKRSRNQQQGRLWRGGGESPWTEEERKGTR